MSGGQEVTTQLGSLGPNTVVPLRSRKGAAGASASRALIGQSVSISQGTLSPPAAPTWTGVPDTSYVEGVVKDVNLGLLVTGYSALTDEFRLGAGFPAWLGLTTVGGNILRANGTQVDADDISSVPGLTIDVRRSGGAWVSSSAFGVAVVVGDVPFLSFRFGSETDTLSVVQGSPRTWPFMMFGQAGAINDPGVLFSLYAGTLPQGFSIDNGSAKTFSWSGGGVLGTYPGMGFRLTGGNGAFDDNDSLQTIKVIAPTGSGVRLATVTNYSVPTAGGTTMNDSKHQKMAYRPANGKVYVFVGDTARVSSGDNSVYSFSPSTPSTWAIEWGYAAGTFCPTGTGKIYPNAGDELSVSYDSARDRFWVGPGNYLGSNRFCAGNAGYKDPYLLYFDPTTNLYGLQGEITGDVVGNNYATCTMAQYVAGVDKIIGGVNNDGVAEVNPVTLASTVRFFSTTPAMYSGYQIPWAYDGSRYLYFVSHTGRCFRVDSQNLASTPTLVTQVLPTTSRSWSLLFWNEEHSLLEFYTVTAGSDGYGELIAIDPATGGWWALGELGLRATTGCRVPGVGTFYYGGQRNDHNTVPFISAISKVVVSASLPAWLSGVSQNQAVALPNSQYSSSGAVSSNPPATQIWDGDSLVAAASTNPVRIDAYGGMAVARSGLNDKGTTRVGYFAVVPAGGGHADYYGNECVAYGPLQDNSPTWRRIADCSDPVPRKEATGSPPAPAWWHTPAGYPVSRHLYSNLDWIPEGNQILLTGGSLASPGGDVGQVIDRYQLGINANAQNPWTEGPTPAVLSTFDRTPNAYDWVNKKHYHCGYQGASFYQIDTTSFTTCTRRVVFGSGIHYVAAPMGAVVPSRQLFIAFGAADGAFNGISAINLSTIETVGWSKITNIGGTVPSQSGRAIAVAEDDETIYCYTVADPEAYYTLAIPVNWQTDQWTFTRVAITGSPPSAGDFTFAGGSPDGRFRWVPAPLRGLLIWPSSTSTMRFVRLF